VLILARHGRTAANAQRLLLGRMDLPLDDFGVRQAAAVGAALAKPGNAPLRIVASPLFRAMETARAIADAYGVDDVTTDERWIEVDYGDFDGEHERVRQRSVTDRRVEQRRRERAERDQAVVEAGVAQHLPRAEHRQRREPEEHPEILIRG
jgi:uncharacterized phosphatase